MLTSIAFLILTGPLFGGGGKPDSDKSAGSTQPYDGLFSISIAGAEDWNRAYELTHPLGLDFFEFPLNWDEVLVAPGRHVDPGGILEIANTAYSQLDTPIVLGLNPIDTVRLRVPNHLRDRDFDDPEVVGAYLESFDFMVSKLPDLRFQAIVVGNEIDGFLSSAEEWAAYGRFFAQVADQVRRRYPGVPVGVKGMMGGFLRTAREELLSINRHSDAVMLTYYPLNGNFHVEEPDIVQEDFHRLSEMVEKEIYLLEVGYPSSWALGSSEKKQAEFVEELFIALGEHPKFSAVQWVWCEDIGDSVLADFEEYYGLSDRGFLEYLGSLGLFGRDGTAKLAWEVLVELRAER